MFTKDELKAFRRICDSIAKKDAVETYRIHWQNLEAKRKGWTADINHRDEIKASSLKEALQKLSYSVAFDCGTHYALIVSISTDKTSYQFSGRLDELLRTVKDSKTKMK